MTLCEPRCNHCELFLKFVLTIRSSIKDEHAFGLKRLKANTFSGNSAESNTHRSKEFVY